MGAPCRWAVYVPMRVPGGGGASVCVMLGRSMAQRLHVLLRTASLPAGQVLLCKAVGVCCARRMPRCADQRLQTKDERIRELRAAVANSMDAAVTAEGQSRSILGDKQQVGASLAKLQGRGSQQCSATQAPAAQPPGTTYTHKNITEEWRSAMVHLPGHASFM